MPTLTLEHTSNIRFDTHDTLRALNHTLLASGQFNELDIKSRALCMTDVVIGTEADERGFVIIKLGLLSGRSVAVRDGIADALLAQIQQLIPAPTGLTVQYCIDLVEHERERYRKAIVANTI